MTWLPWLQENWYDTLQTLALLASFAFTAISLRRDERSRRVENLFRLTAFHREIWSRLDTQPELNRVLTANPDLSLDPVTDAENRFVGFLVLHLNTSHQAIKNGLMEAPEGLGADIRAFFAYPVPRAAWENLRHLQDARFVAFVERHFDSFR